MRPFISFYGGKWRAAPNYPAPKHGVIVEPFAGSAGYSVRHATHDVRLYDLDEKIIATWQYLIGASERDILSLPVLGPHDDLRDLALAQEERWLIGWWLNKGMTAPCHTPSKWMREPLPGRLATYWGAGIRARLAGQVDQIRHWRAEVASYVDIPEIRATWFVDPPYIGAAGRRYSQSNRSIDYDHLSAWCRERPGQVIVCENADATWLPFALLGAVKATAGRNRVGTSMEGIWINER